MFSWSYRDRPSHAIRAGRAERELAYGAANGAALIVDHVSSHTGHR